MFINLYYVNQVAGYKRSLDAEKLESDITIDVLLRMGTQ